MSRYSSLLVQTAIVVLCGASVCAGATPTSTLFQADILGNHFVYGPDGRLYLFQRTKLLRLVNEQGDTWETVVDGVSNVAIDPTNANILYAVTSVRPIKVIKSLDKGKTWLTVSNGLENRVIYALTVNPANSQEIFFGL